MPRISVYEDDPLCFCCDLEPDITAAAQRRISEDELLELKGLLRSYHTLQYKLAEIRNRPELEFDEIWNEENA